MKRRFVLVIGLAASLAIGACGGDDDQAGSTTSTTAPQSETTGTTAAGTGALLVDANKATVAELTSAFEAAAIPNAGKWAKEVEEYRPYPTDDPTFGKLRAELAKYNPSDAVLNQIVAALKL